MPFLPSSGPLSINDIRNLFGGPASPSMANYYRGGAYVPSTKSTTTTVREPTSGDYYQIGSGMSVVSYYWAVLNSGFTPGDQNGNNQYMWNRFPNQGTLPIGSGVINSFTSGSDTYYKGSYRTYVYDTYIGFTTSFWGIYRTYQSTVTVNINTSVPTSGQISISQFYGAEKP